MILKSAPASPACSRGPYPLWSSALESCPLWCLGPVSPIALPAASPGGVALSPGMASVEPGGERQNLGPETCGRSGDEGSLLTGFPTNQPPLHPNHTFPSATEEPWFSRSSAIGPAVPGPLSSAALSGRRPRSVLRLPAPWLAQTSSLCSPASLEGL